MAHKKGGREAVLLRSLPLYVSRAIAVAVKPVIAIIGVERGALRFQTVARSILGGPISSKMIESCLSLLLPSSLRAKCIEIRVSQSDGCSHRGPNHVAAISSASGAASPADQTGMETKMLPLNYRLTGTEYGGSPVDAPNVSKSFFR